jgi:hypothetical protein
MQSFLACGIHEIEDDWQQDFFMGRTNLQKKRLGIFLHQLIVLGTLQKKKKKKGFNGCQPSNT